MIIKNLKRAKQILRNSFDSVHNKISRGYEFIFRARPRGRGEEWRGGGKRHDDKK